MTTQLAIHAYSRVEDLNFRVTAIQDAVTGADLEGVVRHDEPDFGRRLIDITECGNWLRLRLILEAEISRDQLKESIGASESPASATLLQVVIACRATKLRRAYRFTSDSSGIYSASVTVDRNDVAGAFDLILRLVRSRPLMHAEDGKAAFEGALLGEAEPLSFVVEKSELPYTGQFRVVWKDFASADEEELKRASSAQIFVRTDGPPTVLLNEGIPDFKLFLTGAGSTPVEVAMQNVMAASIGSSVWKQLTFAAIASLVISDEAGERSVQAPSDWKGSVARSFVAYAFPGMESHDALLHAAVALRDPVECHSLVSAIGAFGHVQSKTRQLFTQAARAARRAGEDS